MKKKHFSLEEKFRRLFGGSEIVHLTLLLIPTEVDAHLRKDGRRIGFSMFG